MSKSKPSRKFKFVFFQFPNRSPSPHHQISKNPSDTDAFHYPGQNNKSTGQQSPPNPGIQTGSTNQSPVRYRNNHDRNRDRERPTSCRYEYERNYERIYSQPVEVFIKIIKGRIVKSNYDSGILKPFYFALLA